jgi:hypothetical protein
VRLAEYTPDRFASLKQFADRIPGRLNLTHRPFVDYYYTGNPWCRLFLALAPDGSVQGTIGVDEMCFASGTREMRIGFGSNYYSLQPGAGGYLYVQWMKQCPYGIVFGGSDDTHRILEKQRWTYFHGVRDMYLNRKFNVYPGEAFWRVAAKAILRRTHRRRLLQFRSRIPPEAAGISVSEEADFSVDMLPAQSPFTFRFAPTVAYLRWRYNTRLEFVRYRLFRITSEGKSLGYVILNESPDRIYVAQCDGVNASILAYGVLRSILEAGKSDEKPRMVQLNSSHSEMCRIFETFGFHSEPRECRFALGALRESVDVPPDTSNWLINLDWGDNGLRPPFCAEAS